MQLFPNTTIMEIQDSSSTFLIITCICVSAGVTIASLLACFCCQRRMKIRSNDHQVSEAFNPSQNIHDNISAAGFVNVKASEVEPPEPEYINNPSNSNYEDLQTAAADVKQEAIKKDGSLFPIQKVTNPTIRSIASNRQENVAADDDENGYIIPETVKKTEANMNGYEVPMKGINVTPELDGYVQPMNFMSSSPCCNEAYVEFVKNVEEREIIDQSAYATIATF